MRYFLTLIGLLGFSFILFSKEFPKSTKSSALDGSKFSTHLHQKFQVKSCTNCHDFFEKELKGLLFNSHKNRTADTCVDCHDRDVTGFKDADDWFAQPGLYISGMSAKMACETIKTVLHARFKNNTLVARQMEKHLFEDPRVLWGIEGATPNSGKLPEDKKEIDLVKGGMTEWKSQVTAWIKGGMKCE